MFHVVVFVCKMEKPRYRICWWKGDHYLDPHYLVPLNVHAMVLYFNGTFCDNVWIPSANFYEN